MGKTDPRILKTRRKLKESFLTLLGTHRLGEINIKDLTETAEITRGTFYLHYKDKESYIHVMMLELIRECFETVIYPIEQEKGEPQPVFSLVHLFEYVSERPDFFKVLLKEDATEYRNAFNEELLKFMTAHQATTPNGKNNRVPKDLIMSFLSYSLLGYIISWIDNGQIYAHHFMAQNLEKLLASELLAEADLDNFFVLDGSLVPQYVAPTEE